ncbi:hypothetical protein [Cognatilysobacter segetis]|uniref:hypothetical protein n=1 Tax=Cognatilysobacter segetis TaxID=2492394 RepID=UPI001060B11B|nr:hypothetical protein [Lysobacter segetis]
MRARREGAFFTASFAREPYGRGASDKAVFLHYRVLLMMNRISLPSTVATAVLGIGLMLSGAANAACRQVGDVWLSGDCSPRSSSCERNVVVGYGYYGNDVQPLLTVALYRRTSQSWNFVRYYSIRC